ncbi:MAG: hypothetical protein EXS12_00265 [Phycisphaerales bacterium]|nr:hypothetical protein [Phycisphaerales bacterium]
MPHRFIILCGLLTCSMLLGCPSPQQSSSYPLEADKKLLPADWMELSITDDRLKYLTPTTVELLFDLKNEIAQSRATPLGAKPPMTEALIDQRSRDMNELCNNEMLTSNEILAKSMAPEMYNTMKTNPELYLQNKSNEQQNMRGVVDDWNRWWLIDEPSPLSPYPIVSP